MLSSPPAARPDEIDLRQVFQALRRRAPLILLNTALAIGGTYFLSKQQAPQYEATASVIAFNNEGSNALINNTLVTAPPLPQGAVEEALHSKRIVEDTIKRLQNSGLEANLVQAISGSLNEELRNGSFNRLKVKARLDPQQRGVYEIRAQAESPAAARILAETSTEALLAWDTERAQRGVVRARNSLQEQLRDLGARIASTPAGSLERQSLVAARGQVLQNLSQVAVLESAANGTLTLVAEPIEPSRPVSPKPLRNAALAGLLALFLTSGLVLLRDSFRRRVNGLEDAVSFGLPVLGQLPVLQRKYLRQGFVKASESGPMAESIGFLRINLLAALQGGRKRFVVSSAHPSEGKSSVTAALAASLAASGLKVLVIDFDLRRPSQLKLWSPNHTELVALPGSIPDYPAVATTTAAVLEPRGAHSVRAGKGVDLLPSGAGVKGADATEVLNDPKLGALLEEWSSNYDITLIDSPPMLSMPDTLMVAPHTDGIVLVVEAARTGIADVERTLSNARNANVSVLGLVLNRMPRSSHAYYYGYGYGNAYQPSPKSVSILASKQAK